MQGPIWQMKAWTPLKAAFPEARNVAGDVWSVGGQWYVYANQRNQKFEAGMHDAPFITKLFFAASDGAALRLASGAIEKDDGARLYELPEGLLPGLTSGTYANVLALATRSGSTPAHSVERAEYRLQAEDAFIHKVITIDNLQFCYRQRQIAPEEWTYGIAARLR